MTERPSYCSNDTVAKFISVSLTINPVEKRASAPASLISRAFALIWSSEAKPRELLIASAHVPLSLSTQLSSFFFTLFSHSKVDQIKSETEGPRACIIGVREFWAVGSRAHAFVGFQVHFTAHLRRRNPGRSRTHDAKGEKSKMRFRLCVHAQAEKRFTTLWWQCARRYKCISTSAQRSATMAWKESVHWFLRRTWRCTNWCTQEWISGENVLTVAWLPTLFDASFFFYNHLDNSEYIK